MLVTGGVDVFVVGTTGVVALVSGGFSHPSNAAAQTDPHNKITARFLISLDPTGI